MCPLCESKDRDISIKVAGKLIWYENRCGNCGYQYLSIPTTKRKRRQKAK